MSVKNALEAAGIEVQGAEWSMRALTPVSVKLETVRKVMRLIDNLEDSDDVQEVYHNMEMTEEIAAALDE
jgi:transcriptional/translational regulatory protein YebC/TACO1